MLPVKPVLGFVGAGNVGRTLARAWHAVGYHVAAVHSRTHAHAAALAEQVGAAVCDSPAAVVRQCDLTFLTVPDDAITPVAEAIAATGADIAGRWVVHTSGAHSAHALEPLAAKGAQVGSLHPALPFADVETAMQMVRGAAFAVEAEDDRLNAVLSALVRALEGQVLRVPTADKARYHAALVMASNYTVTLHWLAEQLLGTMGDADAVQAALGRLMRATVANLQEQGTPAALTGPLVRADTGTIAAHLDALRDFDPAYAEVYAQLARLTYTMASERGTDVDAIEKILRQDNDTYGTTNNT